MRTCPFCKTERPYINRAHLYKCATSNNILDYNLAKYMYICFNFPKISQKNILISEYETNLLSLVDIRTKYDIDFKSTQFLLNYYNIHIRGISESAIKISVPKTSITNLKNIGCTNSLGKNTPGYHKKMKTVMEKYGVDDIMKTAYFRHRLMSDDAYLEHFGLTRKEFNSQRVKKIWQNKSEEERQIWLNNSLNSAKCRNNTTSKSKLEIRISNLLTELNIEYEPQLYLKLNNRKRYFYDLYLVKYNLLIEINGNYWHGNPDIYKGDDLIHYGFGDIYAKDLWEKDRLKTEYAISKNYNIITIWENFISNNTDDDLKLYLSNLITNYEKRSEN